VQGLFISWKSALWAYCVKEGEMNFWVKTDSYFPVDKAFLCNQHPVTAAVFSDTIIGKVCIKSSTKAIFTSNKQI
jgi:hypothetical protein